MDFIFVIHLLALLFSFFVAGALLGAVIYKPLREKIAAAIHYIRVGGRPTLSKAARNPILRPGTHPWTAEAVLNPGAAIIDGRTHIIYRAVGMDGVSRLGHASSLDGIVFDDRLPYPAFVARYPGGVPEARRRYSPVLYPSGGSWGGCEDPRMVVIDGRVYVTFNMFENWRLRVAALSIGVEDFLAKRFYRWEGPTILSHSERDKNWVLFPEKINGQFAVLHSIIGDDPDFVRIEYIDDLAKLRERDFSSPDPQRIKDQQICWHNHVRSAGPPPLRTDKGWLVLYHANDHEGYRYKMGAMLLDLDDPSRVLCRAAQPVLTPDERYENDGKPGIVYACGAVVRDGILYIYYGGADKVICVATAPLATFVGELRGGEAPVFEEIVATQTT